mmetsp:Transcript_22035/g.30734  ORF Transcript_22035/g.30734 Transcript_22035/m.30734 type:complete len:630 (-) Transcript_22035:356-2245(-)
MSSSASNRNRCTENGCTRMYDKINIFPEYMEKKSTRHLKHGCRQTVIFGVIVLILLLSLTIFYAIQKTVVAKEVIDPTVQDIGSLVSMGAQPYCECTNAVMQFKEIANVSFTEDTLCEEISIVWPIVATKYSNQWDKDRFRMVLKGLFGMCNIVKEIRTEAIKGWQNQYFTTSSLLDKGTLKQIVGTEAQTLKRGISQSFSSVFQMILAMGTISAPAAYTGEAQPAPTEYRDVWAKHPSFRAMANTSIVSLSRMATLWRVPSLNYSRDCAGVPLYTSDPTATRKQLECYFSFWSEEECSSDYTMVLLHLIQDGYLLGSKSFKYDFDLDYYCGSVQTMSNFPTAALASREFWQWSSFMDPAFGMRMNVSNFTTIGDGISSGFVTGADIESNFENYFEICAPEKCSYVTTETRSGLAIAIVVFGLMGGFITVLNIIIPVLLAPCAPKENDEDETEKKDKNASFSQLSPSKQDMEMKGSNLDSREERLAQLEARLTMQSVMIAKLEKDLIELRKSPKSPSGTGKGQEPKLTISPLSPRSKNLFNPLSLNAAEGKDHEVRAKPRSPLFRKHERRSTEILDTAIVMADPSSIAGNDGGALSDSNNKSHRRTETDLLNFTLQMQQSMRKSNGMSS